MKLINLTKGQRTLAVRGRRKSEFPGTKLISMHRQITGVVDGMDVDHINGDGLDNRRENLRICSHADNQKSHRKHVSWAGKPTASKYKGVHWHRKNSKWCAKLANKYIGSFQIEEDAAIAYDNKARELFGAFAKTNFEVANG